MAHSEENLKNGEASPYFRPFPVAKAEDIFFTLWALLWISIKHILISLTSFMCIQNLVRSFLSKP